MFSIFVTTLFGAAAVLAHPALFPRQSIIPLTTDEINNYNIYAYFAKAAYCGLDVNPWSCGIACSNIHFQTEANGGDGATVQYWYVGYANNLNSVVVAYQGTNTSQMQAFVTDGHLTRGTLDRSLFPQIPDGIEVHKGFRDEHTKAAQQVLSAVQSTMSKHQTNTVTSVGHSLGAALATLNAVYLRGQLPSSTSFKTVTFGLPRVGNKDFADYVDANVPITHITNMKDPIPIVPGHSLGYEHPSGEIHITESGTWGSCPGRENESKECSDGEVPNVFEGVLGDHDGPYNGIILGRCW